MGLCRTRFPRRTAQAFAVYESYMKVIVENCEIPFPFDEYCRLIISVLPKADTFGIDEIRFVNIFSHRKSDKASVACYLERENGKQSNIEINTVNLIKDKIPAYLFKRHQEIAALFLSEIIAHEVGHHAHRFKRHGVKKNKAEKFAEMYARAGYYSYLSDRKRKILSAYKMASCNILLYDKKDRQLFSESRRELVDWIENNPNGIKFP
jgi:hypothetical protein